MAVNSWVLHHRPHPPPLHPSCPVPSESTRKPHCPLPLRPCVRCTFPPIEVHSNHSPCFLCPFFPGMPAKLSTLLKASTDTASPALCCLQAESIIPLCHPCVSHSFSLVLTTCLSYYNFFFSVSLFYFSILLSLSHEPLEGRSQTLPSFTQEL